MQQRFEREIVYNDMYLTSGKAQLLNNEELFIGLSIAIVALFTIWVFFNKIKNSLFSYNTFQDYFES